MSQCRNCACELGPCDPREFCCVDCQDEYLREDEEDADNSEEYASSSL